MFSLKPYEGYVILPYDHLQLFRFLTEKAAETKSHLLKLYSESDREVCFLCFVFPVRSGSRQGVQSGVFL